MIPHTQAYKRLKDQVQESFDFAILVSYSIPFLKHNIRQQQRVDVEFVDSSMMPFRPENFERHTIPVGKLKSSVRNYKREITKTIRLSGFSYFEAYVGDVMKEILDFHGSEALVKAVAGSPDPGEFEPGLQKLYRSLRDVPKKVALDRYRKAHMSLGAAGVAFPTTRWIAVGLNVMRSHVESYRAAEIPAVLGDLLHFELGQTELATFGEIRRARNRIAHGRPEQRDLAFRRAVQANHDLQSIARRIDEHVLQYWLLVDPVSLPYASK